jgi:hypothetical protein
MNMDFLVGICKIHGQNKSRGQILIDMNMLYIWWLCDVENLMENIDHLDSLHVKIDFH